MIREDGVITTYRLCVKQLTRQLQKENNEIVNEIEINIIYKNNIMNRNAHYDSFIFRYFN